MPKAQDKPLKWTETVEHALALAFEGRWTREEIAQKCSVSPRTIYYWLAHPDFQARLAEMRANLAETLRAVAYVDKGARITGLAQMAESARREYEARPWLQEVRQVGFDKESGQPLTLTNESFNRDAHAAFRDALADIAAELGARKNVTELLGSVEVREQVTFYMPEPEAAPPEHTEPEPEE